MSAQEHPGELSSNLQLDKAGACRPARVWSTRKDPPERKPPGTNKTQTKTPLVVVFSPMCHTLITSWEHVPCEAPSGFDTHTLPCPGLLLQPGMELSCCRMWQGTALLPTHTSGSSRFLRRQRTVSHWHGAAQLVLALPAAAGAPLQPRAQQQLQGRDGWHSHERWAWACC